MRDRVADILRESAEIKTASMENIPDLVTEAAMLIVNAVNAGGKVLACGNGGSAADAQHLAAEMVVQYRRERRPFPAIALTTNSSVITAQANDKGFETTFSRQVEAIGAPGDVLVAISTSGISPNVIEAVRVARERHISVIGLTGADGKSLASLCDIAVIVPSKSTPRIQEVHITVIHALCELVETELST